MTSKHLKSHHRPAVNMIAYALTLENDQDVWHVESAS